MTADKITVEMAKTDEYPPGEEWRGKIREALSLLARSSSDQWVKVIGIDDDLVNRARAAAHSGVKSWGVDDEGNEWQLITRYDSNRKILWMTTQVREAEETE